MVAYLLDKGADVGARNEGARLPISLSNAKSNTTLVSSGTGWTALHAAAFQEHGKVVRLLLGHQADPKVADVEGRRPVDYASISEAIWPFFAGSVNTFHAPFTGLR